MGLPLLSNTHIEQFFQWTAALLGWEEHLNHPQIHEKIIPVSKPSKNEAAEPLPMGVKRIPSLYVAHCKGCHWPWRQWKRNQIWTRSWCCHSSALFCSLGPLIASRGAHTKQCHLHWWMQWRFKHSVSRRELRWHPWRSALFQSFWVWQEISHFQGFTWAWHSIHFRPSFPKSGWYNELRVKNLSSAISMSKCFFVTQGISTLTGSPGAAPCLHLSGAFLMCFVMCLLPSGLCSFIPLCPIAWLELAGEAVAGCTVRSESSAIACGISHSNCMLCEQKELALLCYERGMLLDLPDHPEKNKIHCKLHLWGQFTSAMGTPSWFWAGSLKSQADASSQLLSCPKSTFAQFCIEEPFKNKSGMLLDVIQEMNSSSLSGCHPIFFTNTSFIFTPKWNTYLYTDWEMRIFYLFACSPR